MVLKGLSCCEHKDTFDAQLIARLIKERHIVVRKLKNFGGRCRDTQGNSISGMGDSYRVCSAGIKTTGLSCGTNDENVAIAMILGRAGNISEPRRI